MSWFTSRYTASLEQQVAELRGDKARLQIQLDALLEIQRDPAAYFAMGLKQEAEKQQTKVEKKETPRPQLGNWLKTRATLESQDQIVREYEPDKEKSANGSR